jgi:putative flippase GtrA
MPDSFTIFLRKLLVQPTSHGFVQFFRYGIVAVIAFGVDFGLLYVFTGIFLWFYLLSATSSFTVSVAVNYLLSTVWVFAQRTKRDRGTELVFFIGICLIALLLNDILMWIFTSVLGIFYLTSKLITVTLVLFWSFGARRLVFHADCLKRGWLCKFLPQSAGVDK